MASRVSAPQINEFITRRGTQQIIQVRPLCMVAQGCWGHGQVTVGLPDQDQGLKMKGRRKLEPID